MNINDFINFIQITEQSKGIFGHYPFCMVVENKKNELEFICLTGLDSVTFCYDIFIRWLIDRPNKIFLSIDFPKILNAKNDFVLIHHYENEKFNFLSIPYCNKTGERFPIEKNEIYLDITSNQFKKYLAYTLKKIRIHKL